MDKDTLLKEITSRFSEKCEWSKPTCCFYLEQKCVEDTCLARYPDKPFLWCDPCLIAKCLEELK